MDLKITYKKTENCDIIFDANIFLKKNIANILKPIVEKHPVFVFVDKNLYKKTYNSSHKEENSEQSKKYYKQHKNEIIEKTKKYVEENKDKIKKNKDEWYLKNKEKILEKLKQTFVCDCGSEVRCAGKAEHNRSVKHNLYIQSISET